MILIYVWFVVVGFLNLDKYLVVVRVVFLHIYINTNTQTSPPLVIRGKTSMLAHVAMANLSSGADPF